ncbi:LPS export ABC transporter periplasmic protein LptC [Neptunomonas sp.]|uniref:LPS export ABC transporter periplasmic protein LptC n=1 Tax=Neptunomonas sp. TaxID=1971898 RepID=UPI0025EDD587|nr:LPS export ABC transporter periplasmic protein LptC [Neptunomonas sp.]
MFLTRSKTRISLAILLLIPLFLYWIINSDSSKNDASEPHIISGVDYFMKTVSTKQFNAHGGLELTLNSEELNHFPHKNQAMLKQPRINLIEQNTIRLSTQSISGIVYDNTDRFDLSEQVIVTHNQQNKEPSTLKTSELSLYYTKEIAETKAPVEITNQSHITTAIGMTINYKTNTSELLSDVKGTFHAK